MPDRLVVGLAAWIIQDGNCRDFFRGDRAAFALEFYAPRGLEVVESENASDPSLTHAGSGRYEAAGRAIRLAEKWWAIGFGVLAFAERAPPLAEPGQWVRGEIGLGVDPFFYFEWLRCDADAPPLIYDWTTEKIEMQAAPSIGVRPRWRERDPTWLRRKEVARTGAWNDDEGSAEYLLHCERYDGPARRTRGR